MLSRLLCHASSRATACLILLVLSSCTVAVPPGGQPTGPQLSENEIVTADGKQLPLRKWMRGGRPEAVVLGLHGMNDYSHSMRPVGEFLAVYDVAVYAYDQRGFGGAPLRNFWPGTDVLVSDLKLAVRLLRGRYPGVPLICFGESMGGAVVVVAVGEEPELCDGVILSAPAVWGKQTMSAIELAALWLGPRIAPSWVVTGEGIKIRPSDNIPMLRALAADPSVLKGARVDALAGLAELMTQAFSTVPRLRGRILWMTGDRDQLIAPARTRAALAQLSPGPEVKVARYANGYHLLTRDLSAGVVLNDIVAWIFAPQASLPSGADRYSNDRFARHSEDIMREYRAFEVKNPIVQGD
jgi:acylglycerol lipase